MWKLRNKAHFFENPALCFVDARTNSKDENKIV
jgi:hypothetical protein